eukprot:6212720-Pleurochrysis_carterae.AAC.1
MTLHALSVLNGISARLRPQEIGVVFILRHSACKYKGIYVEGTLDLHGEQPWPAWTRLRVPANRNGRELVLQHEVDWRVGDVVVV